MNEFDELKSFVMFVGNNRSGTSIVGAFLNAHPDIACAHQRDVLGILKDQPNQGRTEIFNELVRHSKLMNHSYRIPNNYQGRTEKLYVLGDKTAGKTNAYMMEWADKGTFEAELNSLQEFLNLPIKFIQLYRNPFDVIARMCIAHFHKYPLGSVANRTNHYFQHHGFAKKLEKFCLTDENFTFHKMCQEEVILEPEKQLKGLCEFLEVESYPDYIKDCCSILFEKPRKTSKSQVWLDEEKKFIYDEILKHEELKRYVL